MMKKLQLIETIYKLAASTSDMESQSILVDIEQALMDSAIVPLEPSYKMIKAASTYRNENCCYGEANGTIEGQYKAMIATQQGE